MSSHGSMGRGETGPDGVTRLRRIDAGGQAGPDTIWADARPALTVDTVIRELADLRITIRHAFVDASPEYQLLLELTETGLKDCVKCVRELESRAARHPYNRMLTKVDAAYDTAVRMTRPPAAVG